LEDLLEEKYIMDLEKIMMYSANSKKMGLLLYSEGLMIEFGSL